MLIFNRIFRALTGKQSLEGREIKLEIKRTEEELENQRKFQLKQVDKNEMFKEVGQE